MSEPSHDELVAVVVSACLAHEVPIPEDVDTAASFVADMSVVERMVGGDRNPDAIVRLFDFDDEAVLRVVHLFAALNAGVRLEARRHVAGHPRPALGPREGEAIVEGIVAGMEAAVAVQRVLARRR